jgi:hypothetical protein
MEEWSVLLGLEAVSNLELFIALYAGLVATAFALKFDSTDDRVEMAWRRYSAISLGIITTILMIWMVGSVIVRLAIALNIVS